MPHVLANDDGTVCVRIGSRHGVDLDPIAARRFIAQIQEALYQAVLKMESRNGLTCPHGKEGVRCEACQIKDGA